VQYQGFHVELGFDTDYMLLDEPNEKLKIVHYTGPNRVIHELKDSPLYSKWINR
jgi:ABC-type enterochelin transport system ATPase subunit